MDLRRNAQHQPSRIGLLCRPALLLADGDVVICGFTKGTFKLVDRRSVKPDDVLDASQMADEYAVYLVELDQESAFQRTPATWLTRSKNGSGYRNSARQPAAVITMAMRQGVGAS